MYMTTAALVLIAGSQVGAGGASRTASSGPVTVAFSSKIQTLDPEIAVAFPDQAALHLIGGTQAPARLHRPALAG